MIHLKISSFIILIAKLFNLFYLLFILIVFVRNLPSSYRNYYMFQILIIRLFLFFINDLHWLNKLFTLNISVVSFSKLGLKLLLILRYLCIYFYCIVLPFISITFILNAYMGSLSEVEDYLLNKLMTCQKHY